MSVAQGAPPTAPQDVVVRDFQPRGNALAAFTRRDPELVLDGPAGTGKTRALLEKVNLCAWKYPGMRGLLVRKVYEDLKGSALVTFREQVLHPLDGVEFFGGNRETPAAYRYPNGSELLVGGMDKAGKIMSKEFDLVYVNEATELTLVNWESITSRLRYGAMPYQQLIADCNPDAPTHWLRQRADTGVTTMLPSRHKDNPGLWDAARGEWTEKGAAYVAKLEHLTGVRYKRLALGLWVAAEGTVYEGWDRDVHLVAPRQIPPEWPRYWAVDFGFTNPFVCQWWAEDPDGRLWRYREIYRTQRLVEEHAVELLRRSGCEQDGSRWVWGERAEPKPVAIVCDHDAEDRATLTKHLGMGTVAAPKAVSPGIQAVAGRLKPAGDGKPRLVLVQGARVEPDEGLRELGKPTSTEEEVEGYVWDTRANRRKGEEPVKENDHGMDAMRYLVYWRDSGLVGRMVY